MKNKKTAKPARSAPNAQALEALFAKVAQKISPSLQERDAERAFAAQVSAKLEKALRGQQARVQFVGSAARDTGLRGDRDIDLFAVFPPKYSREHVVEKTFAAAKTIPAKWVTRYAEHPYLQTELSGYKIEVIPCFAIAANSPLKSAVDRSPLHMEYLQNKLSERQKRDVRVLKQLLRNNGIYGAELKIEGFSGLVCEHMVLNYHNLQGILENAGKWKPPAIIDLENAYEGNSADAQKKFPNAPMILIDAVDKNRNAAAAVSQTSLSKFVALSRELLKKPREELFFPKPRIFTKTRLMRAFAHRSTALYLVKAPAPGLVEDILWPQLKKSTLAIAKQFSISGFRAYDHAFFQDEKSIYLLFELEEPLLPAVKIMQGPPVWDAQSVDSFIAQCAKGKAILVRGPYIKGDRVFADKKREEREAKRALQKILSAPAKFGVASHVAKAFKHAKLFEGKNAIATCNSGQAMQALGEYLLKKEPWL